MKKSPDIISINFKDLDLEEINLSDDKINYLIDISKKEHIPVFRKNNKNKKWVLNDKRKIYKDCNVKKKKKIKEISSNISNISSNKEKQEFKNKNEIEIDNLNHILDIIDLDFIEVYGN